MPATQIAGRQIRDGAIDNAKIAAGANIATNKLADGANFVNRDGTVAFTGNINVGNNKIVNLGTPTASGDATTKGYVDGLIAGLNSLFDSKGSARAATTANVTISNPGTATFDGVTLTSGERLFVRAQSTAAENGLYTFNGSGSALTRVADMDAWAELPGAFFAIEEGSTYADTLWLCTNNQGGTLGSTAITFQQIGIASGLTDSNFVDAEVPSGTINGSNTSFTLANTPTSGTVKLYLNGQRLRSGSGNDYTISGTTITMGIAPVSGDYLEAEYRK
jgi:hypothetical protein